MRRIAWLSVQALLCGLVAAQVFGAPLPAAPLTEPPAPQPSVAVQKLLAEAIRLIKAGEPAGGLKAADGALAAARAAEDRAGQADAEAARAHALEGLGRAPEAAAAWRAASETWARLGDGPGQVLTLLGAGFLQIQANAAEAEALFTRALTLGQAETRRPLAAALAIHTAGNRLFELERIPPARQFWTVALAIREKWAPNSLAVGTSLYSLGLGASEQGELGAAEEYYRRALAIQDRLAPDSVSTAMTLNNLGITVRTRGDLKMAGGFYLRALALFQKLTPDSMDVGRTLGNLGVIADAQGDLAVAWDYYQRALTLYTKLEPNSRETAAMLNNLAGVTSERGDLEQAAGLYRRALAMQAKIAPESLELASILGNLGSIVGEQGDLKSSEAYFRRSLAIITKLAPNSIDVARSLFLLGNLALEQGSLEVAKDRYRRALAIQEKLAPDSLEMAGSLEKLGTVSQVQSDVEAAADFFQRALTIREHWAPDSPDVARSLNRLGNLSLLLGYLEEAKAFCQRALAIQERLAPFSLEAAISMDNLALAAMEKGEYETAAKLHQQALAIQEKRAPNSSAVARILTHLGLLELERNDPPAARSYSERALSLQRRLAPDSLPVSDLLFNLSAIARRQGDWAEAERHARQAWELVLRHAGGVDGDEARQAYGSSRVAYASRLIRAQIALGKVGPAFVTMEEGRARALQQLLVERQLTASAVSGPLWSRYRVALAARDRAEQAISQATVNEALARRELAAVLEATSPGRGASGTAAADPSAAPQLRAAAMAAARQLEASQSAYTQARVRADQLWAEIKRSAPRAFPVPLSASQVEHFLPLDAVYVGFVVPTEVEQTMLFLLRRTRPGRLSLSTYGLKVLPGELRDLVLGFRRRVADPDADAPGVGRAGRALFARLFPAEARKAIGKSHRLLISPDGPLWELPFAALVTNASGPPRYLGEEKTITYTPSLTLFVQGCRDRFRGARRSPLQAAVVGDPIFERKPLLVASSRDASRSAAGYQGERTSLFGRRTPPERLPGTRREAEQIARLYQGKPLLGERATEAILRQQLGTADIVHLATHGFLNPVRAMSSGVLLTVPEREPAIGQTNNDGALQAWEIYSQLHLKAELVVLSACETGRGENVAGEGIVGLTRALQCAGARSVVASQWKVADRSTATLMVAFHQKLRAGLGKDEALRQAMAVVRQGPRTSHPFFWAPFFLIGDPDSFFPGGSSARH